MANPFPQFATPCRDLPFTPIGNICEGLGFNAINAAGQLIGPQQLHGPAADELTIGQMVVKPPLHGIATQNSFRALLLGARKVAA